MVLTVMWRIYQENGGVSLKGLPEKIMNYSEIKNIKGLSAARMAEMIRILLAAANFKRKVRLITFCGRTGRGDLL
jgi:hypothetical protein